MNYIQNRELHPKRKRVTSKTVTYIQNGANKKKGVQRKRQQEFGGCQQSANNELHPKRFWM